MSPDSLELNRESPPELSVVIVTFNEQARIRTCIESVFRACRTVASFEVILVDSNSTDRTVEYATEYPITVLQIPSDDLTTPAAGRYVGTQAASGASILYVDGDMALTETWLPRAREQLQADNVAGVDGHFNVKAETDTICERDSISGVVLYDAATIRSVGGFDPQLKALEDVHLGFQLRTAGYRLVRLPEVSADHPERSSGPEPIRRWKRGYVVGPGQVLRRSITSPWMLKRYLLLFRYHLFALVWVGLGGIALVGGAITAVGWVLLSIMGFAVLVTQLEARDAISFTGTKLLGVVGIGRGLLDRPRPRESFPLEVIEVVARGPVHEGSTPLSTRTVESALAGRLQNKSNAS